MIRPRRFEDRRRVRDATPDTSHSLPPARTMHGLGRQASRTAPRVIVRRGHDRFEKERSPVFEEEQRPVFEEERVRTRHRQATRSATTGGVFAFDVELPPHGFGSAPVTPDRM